jgi:hypothetical protein
MQDQISTAISQKGAGSLHKLLNRERPGVIGPDGAANLERSPLYRRSLSISYVDTFGSIQHGQRDNRCREDTATGMSVHTQPHSHKKRNRPLP